MTAEKSPASHYVYIVDDDRDVRRSLSFMLGASQMHSHPFGSGEDFLDAVPDLQPGCVLLDLRMPKMDGFQVLDELAKREVDWPVIVMTGHGEVPIAVRAMKAGALDFVEKPFSEASLMTCFETAFALLDRSAESGQQKQAALQRVRRLTVRETEVLQGLLAGESNRRLAARLGISLRTVEMHRANMMESLEVKSLAEALTLSIEAGLKPAPKQD